MAAFENVSQLEIQTLDGKDIDIRTATLPKNTPPDDGFDPSKHRHPKRPIGIWMAYFNLIRTCFGAGMLGLPLATSQVGIVLGPILNLAIGLLIIHSHITLLWCLHEISRQLKIPYISYRYGFRMAMLRGPPLLRSIGKRGALIIGTMMFLSQLGICTVFLIFTADSLRDLLDWNSGTDAMWCLLVPYIIMEFLMTDLTIISYISLMGNFLNLIGLCLVMYQIFKEPVADVIEGQYSALPIFFSIGSYLFNLSAVGVVLSLDKALKDPSILLKRCGAVNLGMLIPVVVGTVFGALGYWSFSTMEENILRSLPFDSSVSIAAISLYLIAIAFSYPINTFPAIHLLVMVVCRYLLDEENQTIKKYVNMLARPVFVIMTFIVGQLVPFQGPFVAFVGSLCTSLLCLVFPFLMEISLLYPERYGRYNFYLIKDIIIVLIGLMSLVVGVVVCSYLLYIRILTSQNPKINEML